METKDINDESDKIINIIALGGRGVGKTSIIKRYTYDIFEEDTISTIWLNFWFIDIILSNNKKIKLKLVDTAGQERYRSLNKLNFKNGEVILYDKKGSFYKIKEWKQMFIEIQREGGIPSFLAF